VNARRIDYTPGTAAEHALQQAEASRPGMNVQAVLDWLVITAVSAIQHGPWQPPSLHGKNRHRWRLPPAMRTDIRNGGPLALGDGAKPSGSAGGGEAC
jgi:hypothetical protein